MAIENDDREYTRGRLLVAVPALRDPNFDRSVIFMLEHGPEGALGVVINRPSELPVAGTIDDWAAFAAVPTNVFIGGPVSPSSVIALATADPDSATSHWTPVFADIGTIDLEGQPSQIPGLRSVRLFAGYAGWQSGQLEGELSTGSWLVVDAVSEDLLDPEPKSLWWRVLGRQTGPINRLANYPEDPWVN